MLRIVLWYFALVVSVATSFGSFIQGLIEATPQVPPSALNWFIVSYLSGVVAAYLLVTRMRSRLREAEAQLDVRGLTQARLEEARGQLALLFRLERAALRSLLMSGHMTPCQVWNRLFDRVTLNHINNETTFLAFEDQTGQWSIRQEWRAVLEQLLFDRNRR